MRAWLEAQLAAGLPAFAGSEMSGTVAVKQEALNELIATWLAANTPASTAPAKFDLSRARAAIKQARIRGETGTILLGFDIRI
jgi:hypothetical protein